MQVCYKQRKNHHGTVGKLSSEQQFHKSNGITFAVLNFWSCTPSATGSYVRLAGRQNPGDIRDFQNSL